MSQAIIRIDGRAIVDRDSSRTSFSSAFGFPDLHGRDLSAWIDCMTDLDASGTGMTRLHVDHGQVPGLVIDHADAMKTHCPDSLEALLECAAFVNRHRIDPDGSAVLAVVLDG